MQAPSPTTTPSSSRLPTLRPGQQAAMPAPQSTTARPSRVMPSDAAVTAPNPRVRHPGSHHHHHTNNNSSSASTLRGGQSGLSTRSRDTHPSSHSTSIGVHSFFTVDGASHSINSLYGVVTSDGGGGDYSSSSANALSMTNTNNNNNRDSTRNGHSGSSRLRFPPQTLPLPHSHHESYSSTLQSPAFVVPAPPAKLDDAAGHTRTAHLEYTGMPRSLLPSHTYLPSVEGGGGDGNVYGGVAPVQQGGLQALQDATTGLLVRHLTHDHHNHRSEGEEKEGGAAGSSERNAAAAAAAAAADVAPSATASARADALKKAAPFVSAALRDAGVDDRVNPFLLDKMLRRGRRQVAAADAAAAAAAAKARATPKNALAVLGVTVPEEDGEGDAAAAHFSPAAARFHEPPALRAAYEAVPARTDTPSDDTPPKPWEKKAKTPPPPPLSSSPSPRNAFDDVLDEYARDDDDDNNNNSEADTGVAAAAASGKGGASAHHGGQLMALAMSSADYTRLAAAASANDAALVRQLVNYYTAQLQASATRRPGAATAAAGDGGRQFSLLEAVLAVSREYVGVRASEVGMPGRGTAALSTRRRHVVTQLLTLNQTRIPESLWVTSAPPLSRLNALTTAAATSTAGRKSPALRDGISGGSGSGGHNTHGNHEGDDGGGDDDRKDGARRALTGSPAVLTAATLSRLEGARPSAERRNSVDAASVTAAQREDSIHQSQRANITEAAAAAPAGSGTPGNTIFPAARPTDRSQVYMLAEVLDRMLHDPAHPQWVELLCNPEVARYVFSDSETRQGKDGTAGLDKQQTGGGEGIGGEDAAKGSADAAPGTAGIDYSQFESLVQDKLWGPPGEHRLTAYTSAAYQVLEVLDAGLSELVRQVTCHCTERGALLDLLRQSVVDLAAAQVHVLTQVKQRARADAVAAHDLREENAALRQELETTQRKLAEVTAAHEQLLTNMAPIQLKSDRLDELTARVASKARRFEGRRHDDHLALLQLLEDSMKQTASAAVDRFYNEVEDIQARHGADGGGGDGDRDANVVGFPAEMPSVAAARSHAAEQKLTMERMYTESHQLLRALQDTVDATNAVCSPLYKKMILADVSPVAKVASSKWATIARAVGAFEREKRHRQRVYEVFTEYCTVYRHHRVDDGLDEGNGGGGDHHDDNGNGQPAGVGRYLSVANSSTASAATAARSHGEFFLVDHSTSPQTAAADGAETSIEDEEQRQGKGGDGDGDGGGFASERGQQDASSPAASTEAVVAGRFDAMQQELKSTAPAERQQSTRGSAAGVVGGGNIITYADLEGMSATDCTVDEVNALFRPDFDVRGYLRGSWQAYVHDRKLQEAASSVDDAYTLRLPDLLQMLCDLQTTLAEVTLRMRAMADSGAMQALLRPPLEPPAHPEQPCALCSRRDTCELDRQRRREAMARIARDLQGKMDAVESKSRAAQLERDEARREVRRLQMELQQAAEGNLPASRRGGSGGVRGASHGGGSGGGGARGGSEGGGGGGGRAGGPDSSQNKSSSLMRAQNSSASLYRRGRRETTAPRESSFSKANPRTRKNTSVMPTSPTSSTTRARRSPATFSLTAPEDEADAAGRGVEEGAATPHFAGSMITMLSTSANMSAPSLVSRGGRVDSLQSESETPQQAREQGGNGNTSNSNSSVGGRDTDSIKVQQQQGRGGDEGDEGEEEEEYDDKDPESGETSIPRGRRSTVFM